MEPVKASHRTLRKTWKWRLRPPRLRTLEGAEERHASWLELFFDLVFVIGIAQLALALEKDHSPTGFLWFAALWLPVFVSWQGVSLYMDRFDTDDLYLRFSLFAGMIAITALSMQIPRVPQGVGTTRFALAYIALRQLTISLNHRAYRYVPEARSLILFYNSGYLTSVALWTVSLWVPLPYRYGLWAGGIFIDLLMPPFAGRQIKHIPINATHVAERFGLFTLIVLGESLVAVGLGTASDDWHWRAVVAAILGFATVICLWWVYFDTNAGLDLKENNRGILFAYAHLFLLGALAAVGAGVHLLVKEAQQERLSGGTRGALCGGIAIYLISLITAHRQTRRDINIVIIPARCVVVVAEVAVSLFSGALSPLAFAVCQLIPLLPLIALETFHNTPTHAEGRKQEEAPSPSDQTSADQISAPGVAIGAEGS